MRTQRLACAQDRVFCDSTGYQYKPGQLLSDEAIEKIGPERVQQLISKRRIVEIEMDRPEPPKPTIDEQRVQSGQVIPSKWMQDPAELQELDLDDLNLLILNIDPDAPSAESREGAITRLSADYIPGQ